MDYIVEVRDVFTDLILYYESFDDANTAYHVKRSLEDEYLSIDHEKYIVKLIEP